MLQRKQYVLNDNYQLCSKTEATFVMFISFAFSDSFWSVFIFSKIEEGSNLSKFHFILYNKTKIVHFTEGEIWIKTTRFYD